MHFCGILFSLFSLKYQSSSVITICTNIEKGNLSFPFSTKNLYQYCNCVVMKIPEVLRKL